MIVVDASALVDVLLNARAAASLLERLFTPEESLHAPHVLDLEVAQALRRHCLAGRLSPRRGRQALQDLAALPLRRYPHEEFLARIWQLRENVTAYDAAYLALAELLAAPLVTRDAAARCLLRARGENRASLMPKWRTPVNTTAKPGRST